MIYGIIIIIAWAVLVYLVYHRLPEARKIEEQRRLYEKELTPLIIGKTQEYNEERAEQLLTKGDLEPAEQIYLHLAAGQPRNPKFYNRLGVIYLRQKNYRDARQAFETAVKIDPTVASRFYNLAVAWLELGNKKQARQVLKSAVRLSPENKKYQKMLDEIEE